MGQAPSSSSNNSNSSTTATTPLEPEPILPKPSRPAKVTIGEIKAYVRQGWAKDEYTELNTAHLAAISKRTAPKAVSITSNTHLHTS